MATERYNAPDREKHWQSVWEEADIFRASEDHARPKSYVLEMFPYPSGRIHMGHVRNYAMGDVVARYKRARGFNVLHPMGWDAFGMPAENAAMERKVHPGAWTYANIDTMRGQLKSMGLSLDWSREIATCSPNYYKHQQKLFLDLLKKGLAYRKSSKVNWDPVDQTVLANEQVIDGRGWRSGALVEQRELTQWFFKITDYAEELLSDLDTLDKWPEKVRLMQANWIGRSEGMLVRWALDKKTAPKGFNELEVYTTRPDTLFGASFLAVAADHPLAKAAAEKNAGLAAFCEEIRRMGTSVAEIEAAEKRGFDTGIRAVHPFDASWELPVYVANFILMDYGTGAIFGCPSGDQRDMDFARRYDLPVVPVILPPGENAETFELTDKAYVEDGTMINSRFLDGLSTTAAFEEAAKRLEKQKLGSRAAGRTKSQLSAARLGHLAAALLGLPDPDHPLQDARRPFRCRKKICRSSFRRTRRSTSRAIRSTGIRRGSMSLARSAASHRCVKPTRWIRLSTRHGISCVSRRPRPRRRSTGKRRSTGCPSTSISAASSTRFCIFSIRASSCGQCATPAICRSRRTRASRSRPFSHRAWSPTRPTNRKDGLWLLPNDVKIEGEGANRQAVEIATGEPAAIGSIEKMSKSKKNLVDPDDIISHYGADCARWFMLSDSPPERDVIWTEAGVAGAGRFIQRVWRIVDEVAETPTRAKRARSRHRSDRTRWTFGRRRTGRSTGSARPSKPCGSMWRWRISTSFPMCSKPPYQAERPLTAWALREAAELLVPMIGPMMPHLAEECWARLGYNTLLANEPWPARRAGATR